MTSIYFNPHTYVAIPGGRVNTNVPSDDCFIQGINNDTVVICIGVILLKLTTFIYNHVAG